MERSIFRALAQTALSEREQKSLSGGNVCGCACRSNSSIDNGCRTIRKPIMRKIIIFILFCTICNSAYAQLPPAPQILERKECIDSTMVELVYSFKFKFNRNGETSEDIRKVQIGRKYVKDFSYIVFYYDSIATERMKKGLQSQNIPSQTYPCEITTEINTHRVSEKYRMMLNAGVLCYKSVVKPQEWQYSDTDTLTIAGYLCHKANTLFAGRQYRVWYNTDVPMPYGPYKFFGLPGLVMKIEEENGLFVWELNKLEFVQKPIFDYKYEGEQECSEAKAKQIIRRMMTSPMSFLQSVGTKMMVRRSDGSFVSPSNNNEQQAYEPLEIE